MASVTSSTGSSIDVNALVTQLMTVERKPLDKISSGQQAGRTELSALGQISNALSALSDAAASLQGTSSKFQSLTTSSSDSSVATATATGVPPGQISLTVNRLATQQKIASSSFTSANQSVGSGILVFDFGKEENGAFSLNDSRSSVSVTIPSDATSLSDVRDAVNQANAGVRASIVTNASGSYLTFSTVDGGSSASMRVSVADDDGDNTDTNGLSALAFDPTGVAGAGKNMTQTVAGQDAEVVIDGTTITSTNNQLKDAVKGVQINLLKTTAADSPVTITLERNASDAQTAVENFVKAYNTFNSKERELTAYDPTSKSAGALQSDTSMRRIVTSLRSVIQSSVSAAGSYSKLNDIGITLQSDGSLKLDSTKFKAAYNANPDSLDKLFSNKSTDSTQQGFAYKIKDAVTKMLDSQGTIGLRTQGVNDRIKRLEKQQSNLETRMTLIEARYRQQFTALDATLSGFNSTSSFLTQQISSLNKTA